MGSICCVAARSRDITRSSDGWSLEQSRANWRNQGGFSPPLSSRWDHKWQASDSTSGHNSMHLHQASFSSSRSGSQMGSCDTLAYPYDTPERILFAHNSPDNFHYSRRSLGIADAIVMPSEQFLRLSSASSQEGLGGISAFSKSVDSQKALEDFEERLRKRNSQSLYGIVSKRGLLSRQRSDTSAARGKADSWTAHAFSELVGSSQSRSLRWTSPDYSMGAVNDEYKAPQHSHMGNAGEGEKCGLCLEAVSHRSRWGPEKILSNTDLPVVGVLVCGHVYHVECLERATPLSQLHDPPCPQCDALDTGQLKLKLGDRTYSNSTQGLPGQDLAKYKDCEESIAADSRTLTKTLLSGKVISTPEAASKKGFLHMPVLAKPLLKKQFSFIGKANKDPTFGNALVKKTSSVAKVSPESNIREEGSSEKEINTREGGPSAEKGRKVKLVS